MSALIKHHSKSKHADSLADYLPSGRLFEASRVDGTNFRKLLMGLSSELFVGEGYLKTVSDEYDIRTTTLLIEEWEGALGIPDDCFKASGTIEERRRDVLVKLASLGVQTNEGFIDLGTIFGTAITIHAGIDVASVFPLPFPLVFFDTVKEARFTIVVDFVTEAANKFPLIFPFTFGSEEMAVLECLFNRLKPANCDIILRQV